jgi:PAS domain S-box-containing protein
VRTQLLLRQRSSQFETSVNQSPVGILVVDEDLRFVQVNPVAKLVFGEIPDLIGSHLPEIMHKITDM